MSEKPAKTRRSKKPPPEPRKLTRSAARRAIADLLSAGDFPNALRELALMPRSATINALLRFLPSADDAVKSRAAEAIGALVAQTADEDLEAARVIVRRLIWSLTEESGGIGWGSPEAIGEIIVRHEVLAEEYTPLLVSFIVEDANYLEHEPLLRGVVRAIERVAKVRLELVRKYDAGRHLRPLLESSDAPLRELAGRALALIGKD